MRDWNAIVTARDRRWRKARQAAGRFARVDKTGFFNVLVARADEPRALLGQLEALAQEDPSIAKASAKKSPLHVTWTNILRKDAGRSEGER